MKTPKEIEELKEQVEFAKAETELFEEKNNTKAQLRELNHPFIYASFNEAKADVKGFFEWFGKVIVDLNRPIEPVRRWKHKMELKFYDDETSDAQDFLDESEEPVQPVQKNPSDLGLTLDMELAPSELVI